jgi:hypothetical protein
MSSQTLRDSITWASAAKTMFVAPSGRKYLRLREQCDQQWDAYNELPGVSSTRGLTHLSWAHCRGR